MSGIIDLLVPREKKFLEYIEKQVTLLNDSVARFTKLTKGKKIDPKELRLTLAYIENKSEESDVLARETINSLHQTFITPIGREEIKALAFGINHFIDSLEEVANGIFDFKIQRFDSYFLKQIKILQEEVAILRLIFQKPLFLRRNKQYIEDIKELEREGDKIYRRAIRDIFNNGHKPIDIIKQKELYEATEETIDDAKHIVDILETVLINNS